MKKCLPQLLLVLALLLSPSAPTLFAQVANASEIPPPVAELQALMKEFETRAESEGQESSALADEFFERIDQLLEKYAADRSEGVAHVAATRAFMLFRLRGDAERVRELLLAIPKDFPGTQVAAHIPTTLKQLDEAIAQISSWRAPNSILLTIGQRRTGEIVTREGRDGLVKFQSTDKYSFAVREAGEYVIEMTSDKIDSGLPGPFRALIERSSDKIECGLRLLRGDGTLIAEDGTSQQRRERELASIIDALEDDYFYGIDAPGPDASIVRYLTPGGYVIEASSGNGNTGSYQIEVRRK